MSPGNECVCGGPIRLITIKPQQQPESGDGSLEVSDCYAAYGSCNHNGCSPVYLGDGPDRRKLAAAMQAQCVATWRETRYL